MLVEEPRGIFSSKKPLTQWYGHVHLLPDHVVGQWFVLKRSTGDPLWRHSCGRANTICGFDSGVIVASETRSDGPWTFDFGCYGVSIDNGRMLWTSHREGFFGLFVRGLDFIPLFTNELRDSPHHVSDGEVFCNSGRVLNVLNGKLVERQTREMIAAFSKPDSIAQQFYTSKEDAKLKVTIGQQELWLSHLRAKMPFPSNQQDFFADDKCGQRLWSFSLNDTQRHIDGNFFSYRLDPPHLYLIVSDEPRYRQTSRTNEVEPNPTRWHLLTLDLHNGEIVQEISLGLERQTECRIEDLDDTGMLISRSGHDLLYCARTPSQE